MAYTWQPALTDVAAYIPTRTLPTDTPGSDVFTGTFSASTTPTDTEALVLITAATEHTASAVGVIQTATLALAKITAAIRAAAFIELAYPVRDADVAVADSLTALADKMLETLILANTDAGGVPAGTALPAWSFLAPPAWGDSLHL